MGTEGNALVDSGIGGFSANPHLDPEPYEQSVTDPTLANGDGTYSVTFGEVAELDDSQVLGISWDGSHRATLNGTSANGVEVLFEEPDGAGNFTTVADGQIAGTLTVVATS